MDDFADFSYPEQPSPAGVIGLSMPRDALAAIATLAPTVWRALSGPPDRSLDCRLACKFWLEALARVGVKARLVGGEGIDDDVFRSDYRLVPLDRRSGYREADEQVHRHYWLVIGADDALFDPTAHQFDRKGGVSLVRYVVDGTPVWLDK